ncbi:M48 family metallopeptidase [Simplicispira sedimenti]|uniref:M48 family metallopeptidase n=1 Tax=Simplicispira sedimenti TaxID=2919500 RepID=UPI001FA95E16
MNSSHQYTSAPRHLLPGRWFDGRSSQARPVLVGLRATARGPSLHLHPLSAPGAAPVVFAHQDVGWPEAWNARRPQARVVVDLRDHGSLEIDAVSAWHAALAAAGARPGLAQRMQTRWSVLLAVLLAAAIGLTLFYRYGTPWMATQLTRWVPVGWEAALADQGLQQMDDGLLKPSKLPPERQAQLRARFDALAGQIPPALQRYPGYAPRLQLEFRSGLGANAFALPGGQVVMTDGLVQAAAKQGLDDDALVGVLAHEIGHVVHRHTTRMVVEQGVLQMGLGLALGDVSGVLSTGGALLTGLHYRRNHEREADCFAIDLMRHAALPTAPMGTLLLAIAHDEDDAEGSQKSGASQTAPQKQGKAEAAHPIWSLLSSHPDTVERAHALQQGQSPHCSAP